MLEGEEGREYCEVDDEGWVVVCGREGSRWGWMGVGEGV